MNIKGFFNVVTDVIFPPVCVVCAEPLGIRYTGIWTESENREMTSWHFHEECKKTLSLIREPMCQTCGKRLSDITEMYCRDCKKYKHTFLRTVALYEYNTAIKQSIYRFKYKNKREYADTFAGEILEKYGRLFKVWGVEVCIPVPMFEKKKKVRGYNQAEILSERIATGIGVRSVPDALVRIRNTAPMKELTDSQRHVNLKGAVKAHISAGDFKRVLLVDDIYTTGSTFDACAQALESVGVKEIYGVCICIGEGI